MIPFVIAFYRLGQNLRAAINDPDFEAILTLLLILLAVGTFFYHDVEGWNWLNSLYFCVITLTTVGYGDLYPHTDLGKIFTMGYLFLGIGVLLAFINLITTHSLQKRKDRLSSPSGFPGFLGRKSKPNGDADNTAQVG